MIVRGEGCHLFDDRGNSYLDCKSRGEAACFTKTHQTHFDYSLTLTSHSPHCVVPFGTYSPLHFMVQV